VRDDWIDLSNLMNDLTGKLYAIPNPWSKMAEKAFDLIDRHGWQAFEERARLVAGRVGKNPGVDEIIFGVGNSMRRGVDTADVAKQERAAEAASVTRSRVEKTQLQLHGYGQHGDGPENHPACPSCAEVPV
jgi:hypothetical protein